MDSLKIAIITPTYKRNLEVVERCIFSVLGQLKSIENKSIDIVHYVVYDDLEVSEDFEKLYSKYKDIESIKFLKTGLPNSNTWGAFPRKYVIDNYIKSKEIEYYGILFLDDDNVLFPNYVSKMVQSLENYPDVEACICKIIHMGPLSSEYFPFFPNVVEGNPPVLKNIDTLNVMFRTQVFEKFEWVHEQGESGYYNDGYTYSEIFKSIKFMNIPDILAVHL